MISLNHTFDCSSRRTSIPLFKRLIKSLGDLEIDAVRPIDGVCPKCSFQYYGRLDEGRMSIPIGLKWKIDPSYTKYLGYFDGEFRRPPYAVRQEIVRSGIWNRDQLGHFCFSQHELEVNDRSYCHIRPRRCDCDYGAPTGDELTGFYTPQELSMLREAGVLPMLEVEEEFVLSNPVRTGFRRRSRAAILRRRRRALKRRSSGPIEEIPRIVYRIDEILSLRNHCVPVLALPDIKYHRKTMRASSWRNNMVKLTIHTCKELHYTRPAAHHTKYWYRYRKTGKWTCSTHHRYGDECSYYCYKISRKKASCAHPSLACVK